MKRSKFLVLALVVAIMMMGAGYAYWTLRGLSITNTVDTGDLKVVFREPANVENESKYQPNADCSVINKEDDSEYGYGLRVTFREVYPGLKNKIEFNLDNLGTLGAYVDDFEIRNYAPQVNEILCNKVTIKGDTRFSHRFEPGTTLNDALAYINENVKGGKGIFVDTTLVEADSSSYSYNPGNVTVIFDIEFDPDATVESLPENYEFGFDIFATVYQYNHDRQQIAE